MTRLRFLKIPIQVIFEITPGLLQNIGGWQITGRDVRMKYPCEIENYPIVLSPFHGRSLYIPHLEYGNISIKGCGWTLGSVSFYPSPKDQQMHFGLYPLKDGLREWKVSEFLRANLVQATQVLGLATFNPEDITNPLLFLDGSRIEPTLLFVQSKSPWRVADLVWLDSDERTQVIKQVCIENGWNIDNFVQHFCHQLATTMAHYHRLGCINDSLSWDNTTLAGEITDFEWFTTPEQTLPDGSQYENTELRRRKEAIYAYEIGCLLLRALKSHQTTSLVIDTLYNSYKNGDPAVADELRKLLNSVEVTAK